MKTEIDHLVKDDYNLHRCIDFDCGPETAMAFLHDRSKTLSNATSIILHYRFRGDTDAASAPLRTPATTPLSWIGEWWALMKFVHRLDKLKRVELWIGESFWRAVNFDHEDSARTIYGTRDLFYAEAHYMNYDPDANSDDKEVSTQKQNIFQRVARIGDIVLDLNIDPDDWWCGDWNKAKFERELLQRIVLDSSNRPLLHEYQPCSCTKADRLGGNLNIFRKTCEFFQEVPK